MKSFEYPLKSVISASNMGLRSGLFANLVDCHTQHRHHRQYRIIRVVIEIENWLSFITTSKFLAMFDLQSLRDLPVTAPYKLSGEGSWKLLSHEQLILMAAIENFDTDVQKLLLQQLHQEFFVERTNNRISVLRFCDAHDDLRAQGTKFEDKWMRVHILVNNKKQISNVNIYRGLVFSVETRSPRKTYRGAEICVAKVVDGKGTNSLTTTVDRQEHGTG